MPDENISAIGEQTVEQTDDTIVNQTVESDAVVENAVDEAVFSPEVDALDTAKTVVAESSNKTSGIDNSFVVILTGVLLFMLQMLYLVGKSTDGNVGTAVVNPSQLAQIIYNVLDTYIPGLLGLFFIIFGSYDFDKSRKSREDEADNSVELGEISE